MRDTLTTERLVLRPLKREDAGPISLFCSDFNVARMLARIPHPYPPGAAEAFVERALSGRVPETVYAIESVHGAPTGFVGVTGLRRVEGEPDPRLGYWLGRPAWGRGMATEAVRAVIDEGFAQGLERLASDVFLDNAASRRVLEKTGFLFGEEFDQFCPARSEMVRAIRCFLDREGWRALKSAELR